MNVMVNGKWGGKTPPSVKNRRKFASTAVNRNVYIFGGTGGFDNEPLRLAKTYDGQSGSWFAIPPMRYPRYNCTVVLVGNEIYVLGGLCHETYSPGGMNFSVNSLMNYSHEYFSNNVYNTLTRNWRRLNSQMIQPLR